MRTKRRMKRIALKTQVLGEFFLSLKEDAQTKPRVPKKDRKNKIKKRRKRRRK